MDTPLAKNLGYFQTLFEAVPVAVLVVDDDVRILDYNEAAKAFLGKDKRLVLKKRGGEALNCLHIHDNPKGCGHGLHCQTCILRGSVQEAAQGGKVSRRRARMVVESAGKRQEVFLLITAARFAHEGDALALVTLEDISELIKVQSLLPVCAWCKKVRNDKNYWQTVEAYLKSNVDVQFTHGICDECLEKQFPESDVTAKK